MRGPNDRQNSIMNFIPRPFQETALQSMNFLHARQEYCKWLLVMPCGAGKTYSFLYWLSLKPETDPIFPLWLLVHEGELADQWATACSSLFEVGEFCVIAAKSAMTKPNKRHVGLKSSARIIVCMEKRVESSRPKADLLGLNPRSVFIDEAHLMIFREGTRQARVWMYGETGQSQFGGLTGSPVNHSLNQLQLLDFFKREDWATPVSNAELIRDGYWAKLKYMDISPEYLDRAESLFKGLREQGGNLDVDTAGNLSTSASAVMKKLLPEQVAIMAGIERRASESYMVFCSDREHAREMSKALSEAWGIKVPIVVGETPSQERSDILEGIRSGTVPVVCLVGCWLCGTDIPNCCTVIFCTAVGSFPDYVQMATRAVRPGKGDCIGLETRIYDLALNVAKHGFIEDAKFDPGADLHMVREDKYRHANALICQNPACCSILKAFPKPYELNEEGQLRPCLPSSGLWRDGAEIDPKTPIGCPKCGQKLTANLKTVTEFIEWKYGGADPENMPEDDGLLLGDRSGYMPVTYGFLRDLGWYCLRQKRETEEGAIQAAKDRSDEWREKRATWTEIYATRLKRCQIFDALGSDFGKVLSGYSKEGLRSGMSGSVENLIKSSKIMFAQSFERGTDPMSCLREIALYPAYSKVLYGENADGKSAVALSDGILPEGYKAKRVPNSVIAKTVFLFGFTRTMVWAISTAPNAPMAVDLLNGWVSLWLDKYSQQQRTAESLGDDQTAQRSAELATDLQTMLDLVSTVADEQGVYF